jgi:hypothetical protein
MRSTEVNMEEVNMEGVNFVNLMMMWCIDTSVRDAAPPATLYRCRIELDTNFTDPGAAQAWQAIKDDLDNGRWNDAKTKILQARPAGYKQEGLINVALSPKSHGETGTPPPSEPERLWNVIDYGSRISAEAPLEFRRREHNIY